MALLAHADVGVYSLQAYPALEEEHDGEAEGWRVVEG